MSSREIRANRAKKGDHVRPAGELVRQSNPVPNGADGRDRGHVGGAGARRGLVGLDRAPPGNPNGFRHPGGPSLLQRPDGARVHGRARTRPAGVRWIRTATGWPGCAGRSSRCPPALASQPRPHHRGAGDDDSDLQAGASRDRDDHELDQPEQPCDGQDEEPQRPPRQLSSTPDGLHGSRRLSQLDAASASRRRPMPPRRRQGSFKSLSFLGGR